MLVECGRRNSPLPSIIVMTTDEIKTALRQLHGELSQTESADPELTELLRQVEQDIHGVLDQPQGETESSHLTSRIDEMAISLEEQHPKLTPVLRQVSEALSRMGI